MGSYVVGRVRRLRLQKTLFKVIGLGSSGGVVWLVCLAGVGGRLRLRKDGFRLFGSGGARPGIGILGISYAGNISDSISPRKITDGRGCRFSVIGNKSGDI